MIVALLTAYALVLPIDADLAARLQLAAVPGAQIVLADGPPLPPSRVRPPPCTPAERGLCDVNWESMPGSVTALRAGAAQGKVLLATERGDPLLLVRPGTVTVAMALPPDSALRRWPYFNYVLHAAACVAAGGPPPRFGDWPGSPQPHAQARRVLFCGLAALWALGLGLYRVARRRGRDRPDAAAAFFAAAAAATRPSAGGLEGASDWGRAGFSRPLAGLLTLLASMLLLIGPYFAVQSVLATHVQPFPEADGLWRTTFETLYLAWLTFDLGTQTAFVKYFAEHRVSRPEDALRDVQFYVWFQVFTRLAEASVLCALAAGWLPYSRYALYAPFVILYSACFLPAVSGLGKFMCQALQRFDYYNLLDMAEYRLLVFVVPIPLVLAGRAWGAAHPAYGEAFGAAVGLGLGQLCTNLVMLALGLWVLRRLGLPIGPLFLAQFRTDTARRQLVFGLKLTVGQEPFRLTAFFESLIIIRWLNDFPTWLGIRDLLYNRLTWLYFFAWGYYQSAVPALSEALAAGKRRLAQYYVARYFQFGFLFSAAIFSLLAAVGPAFIHGALGPQWWRAADYLILASATGLLLPPAWISDSLQQGAGRPGTMTVVYVIEQGVRLLLFFLLIPRLQFAGIYVAMLIALSVKAVVAWSINHTRIVPLRLPPWTSVGAPAVAGLLNYLLWRAVTALAAPAHTLTVLLLFFVAGAGSFCVCFFACGLAGGLDPAALGELDQASRMSALVRPLCRALSACAHAGARLAPLRAPELALATDARAEAAAIDELEQAGR